jgi:hypothetical protein
MIVYKYFLGCESYEAVKRMYRELAKTLHPDKPTGNHDKFVAMQAEYNLLGEGNYYPLRNVKTAVNFMNDLAQAMGFATAQEAERTGYTHLDPKELEKQRAENFFRVARQHDVTYDVIDGILAKAKKESLPKLWVYQEIGKQWDLTLDHFKYLTFKQGDTVVAAKQLYMRYKLAKV